MKSILKFLIIALAMVATSATAQSSSIICDNQVRSTINLGTGLDAQGNPIAPAAGVFDPFWTLTTLPVLTNCTDADLAALSERAYLVNFNNANSNSWVNQDGVTAISPVDAGTLGGLSCRQTPGDPFVFERYFCLQDGAEVNLDVTFKGDDRLQLELVDMNTDQVLATSERYVYQNPPLAPIRFNVRLGLNAGTYALRAKYENDAVAAGFSIAGSVTMLPISATPQLLNASTSPVFNCNQTDTLAQDNYYFYPDSALTICADPDLIPVSGPYTYQWYAPDGRPLASNGDCYTIPVLNANTVGTYYCQIIPDGSDVCYILPVKVDTYVQDPTGAWYIPNQLVVKYRNDITEAEKLAYIDRIGATRLESCICLIDLLQLPDTMFTAPNDTIIDPEEKKKKAGSDNNEEVESAGHNTTVTETSLPFRGIFADRNKIPALPPAPESPVTASTDVVVALIDTGFDFTDSDLSSYIWNNPSPNPMANDTCTVCLTGAVSGYDFAEMDPMPQDEHGHGTNVGKAIIQSLETLTGGEAAAQVSIMPLKVMDKKEQITLFSVTCATVFAVKHGAQVINLSMGAYGGYQEVIDAALGVVAPGKCPPLVITSAGNDGLNNDLNDHFFSNLNDSLTTAISVGALIDKEPFRADYSNFGNKVDLGASGRLYPDSLNSPEGTSIAAGHVSGILAYMHRIRPGLSSQSAKNCLLGVAANNGQNLLFNENSALTIDNLFWAAKLDECLASLPIENCEYTFEPCLVVNTSSLFKGKEDLAVKIIPNPNGGQWSFAFELEQAQLLEIIITDMQGKQIERSVLRYGSGQHTLPYSLGNHPDGVYFYQIISDKYIHAGKIVKQGN